MADVIGPIIAKQGTITLLKDIPWDNTYRHTLLPTESQSGHLQQILSAGVVVVNNLGSQSYSRVSNNVVRIQVSADKAKPCNYMVINNGAGFGNSKNFFCFVTNVEYVNVNTCDVTFEIDYFQTYYYDFTFDDVFVEREHSPTDNFGDNLVPEDLDIGDLIIAGSTGYIYPTYAYGAGSATWVAIIAYVPNYNVANATYVYISNGAVTTTTSVYPPSDLVYPNIRNGMISPVCYIRVEFSNANFNDAYSLIQRIIATVLDESGQIVDIYLVPKQISDNNFVNAPSRDQRTFSVSRPAMFPSIDGQHGYSAVINKKLYQYPFCQLVVSNNNGQTNTYKWEHFVSGNTQAIFVVEDFMQPEPIMTCYPSQYRGLPFDYENAVYFDNFPKVSWSEDSFSKWWGQNKTSFALSLLGTGLSSALMLSTGGGQKLSDNASNDINGLTSRQGFTLGMGASRVASIIGQYSNAQNAPDAANIQHNSAVMAGAQGRIGFTAYCMSITAEMARIIDDYFSVYGYATKAVKRPNFKTEHRRRYYNYLKTRNCSLEATGELPSDAQDRLEKIFDNGITIWTYANTIGEYNGYAPLNSPLA